MDSTYARAFVMLMIVGLVLRPVGSIVNSGKSPFFHLLLTLKLNRSAVYLTNTHAPNPATLPLHVPKLNPVWLQ